MRISMKTAAHLTALCALAALAGCARPTFQEISRPLKLTSPAVVVPSNCPFASHPAWQVLDLDDSTQAVLSLLSDTCRNGDLRTSSARLALRRGGMPLRQWDLDTCPFPAERDASPIVWAALRLDAVRDSSLRVCQQHSARCLDFRTRETMP